MSNLITQASAAKRGYRLGKRAEKQQETRQRIIEAAAELHGTLGPARTSVVQVAELAGVQRHTYYAHFPDDRSLFLACSGFVLERDPLPDLREIASVPAGVERIRAGLEALYEWYDRNSRLVASVMRDADYHALTREMVELRLKPYFDNACDVLGEGLEPRSRALLPIAIDFSCWRLLGGTQSVAEAAELMCVAIKSV